jgi:hypothetical protein
MVLAEKTRFGAHDTAHYSMSGCGPDNFDPLTAMEDWVERVGTR